MLPAPINLQAWIDEHRHLLKPPVGNKCIVDDHYIVMVSAPQRAHHYLLDAPKSSTLSRARWCCSQD